MVGQSQWAINFYCVQNPSQSANLRTARGRSVLAKQSLIARRLFMSDTNVQNHYYYYYYGLLLLLLLL